MTHREKVHIRTVRGVVLEKDKGTGYFLVEIPAKPRGWNRCIAGRTIEAGLDTLFILADKYGGHQPGVRIEKIIQIDTPYY